MSETKMERILKNAKTSMEIEGFVIDKELEDTGRKILEGELNLNDYVANYIAQYKAKAARQAYEV
jgi:hypothetical protein